MGLFIELAPRFWGESFGPVRRRSISALTARAAPALAAEALPGLTRVAWYPFALASVGRFIYGEGQRRRDIRSRC